MTRTIWLAGLLCTGCFIVPATKTTKRPAGTEDGRITYGKVHEVTLETGASRTHIQIRAKAKRDCHKEVFAVTEVTKTKHAKLGGADDPRARAFGLFLAPVTIPVSAIITGLIVAGDSAETSRDLAPLRNETYPCSIEAGEVAVEVQFPSGAIERGKTDSDGRLSIAIPAGEPYSGDALVRAGNVIARAHFEQPQPPVTVARDAIETCRAEHQIGSVTLKLTINDLGIPTRVWLSAGDYKFNACVATRISGLIFPRELRGSTVVMPFEAPTT